MRRSGIALGGLVGRGLRATSIAPRTNSWQEVILIDNGSDKDSLHVSRVNAATPSRAIFRHQLPVCT
jgi:hypothetical protein